MFDVLVVVRVCSGALPICLMSYRVSCERLTICRRSGDGPKARICADTPESNLYAVFDSGDPEFAKEISGNDVSGLLF